VGLRSFLRDRRERAQEKSERGRLGGWRRSVVAGLDGRVLDVGAGMGFSLPLLGAAESVVALEPDREHIQRARRRVARAPAKSWLVAGDAQALPFRDGAFDSALGTLVFCTIPDPERAFREVQRAVKPGGAVHLLEHVRVRNPILAGLQDLITPLTRALAGGCHQNRPTVETARRSGLRIEAVRPHLRGYIVEIEARVAYET
jgi:ubiquinone/menaquinone biosynthesis C-methylase UbiE